MKPVDQSTHERIKSAAEALFAEHGYAGVSLRALAGAAQVPLGSIAYHFGSKEGLYRAIWADWMSDIPAAPPFAANGQDEQGIEDNLRQIISAFFAGPRAILREERGRLFMAIMMRAAHDPGAVNRGVMDTFVRARGEYIHTALAGLMPHLRNEQFEVGFHMTVAALRIVIENDSSPSPLHTHTQAEFDQLFSVLLDFVVSGWLGIMHKAPITEQS